jgi:hypothetical protein
MNDLLVVDSAKDFVDAAVRLSQQQLQRGASKESRPNEVVRRGDEQGLTRCLDGFVGSKAGLFNATRNVETFIRGMEVAQEMQQYHSARVRRYHIVIR